MTPQSPQDSHARLVAILKDRSVRRQRVVLASGKESDFYVDARLTTLDPEGAWLIAGLLLARLQPEVLGVGGPVTGADPIAGAVAARSFADGRPLFGFMVRKEPKGHGMRRWVEGRANLPDGAPVAVLEDTTTSGGSLLTAVQRAEAEGLRVVQCLTVVDRQEGASELLAQAGYRLEALTTASELLS